MKKEIQIFEHANEILQALKTGILITTKAKSMVNTMTIAWGTLGIEWNIPIFTAFVREGRYTRELLDENPEFTINVPLGKFDRKILAFCGENSGRKYDKIKEMSLTLENSDCISVPGIKELPLTLECKIIYSQMQDEKAIPSYIKEKHYPQNVDRLSPLANKAFHAAYYGEIVKAYIIE